MMNVGDVVLRLLFDTTQLDSGFDTVEARQKAAAESAATSALGLKAAQKELREAMKATQAQGGLTAGNMERLATAEKQLAIASAEATEAQAALKTQLGLAAAEGGFFQETLGELTGHLGKMLGVLAVVEGVKSFVEHVQESVLQLQKMSDSTGIGITQLAGLEVMSKKIGVSFEALSKGIGFLEVSQKKAIASSGAQRKAFADIGIGLNELKSLNPWELFTRTGEALAKEENISIRNASAKALMGKGALESIPVFLAYAGAIGKTAEELGIQTGVTDKAGKAAREWQSTMVEFEDSMRRIAIPIMQVLVPAMKVLMTAGSAVALAFKDVGATIAFAMTTSMLAVSRFATIADEAFHGHFIDAANDTVKAVNDIGKNINKLDSIWKENSKTFIDGYVDTWGEKLPAAIKKTDGALDEFKETNKHATQDAVELAKKEMEAKVASINASRAALKEALAANRLDITQESTLQLVLTQQERKAKDEYFDHLIALYKKAHDAAKVRETEEAKAADRSKAFQDSKKAQETAEKSLNAEKLKFLKLEAEATGLNTGKTREQMTQVELLNNDWKTFIPQWVQDATKLRNALKDVGIEGLDKMRQKLDAARKAEDLLGKDVNKNGKLYLQVKKAELEALIAIEREEAKDAKSAHKRTQQMEKDLDKINAKLKKFGHDAPNQAEMFDQAMQDMKGAVGEFAADLGTAFAAVIQGQMSMSQAVLQSFGKMISSMCDIWARYLIGLAMFDMWSNPGKAAAELAAAAALKMVGGLAGSLGGGGGAKEDQHPTIGMDSPAGQSSANPTGGQNAPRLASGGLVTAPTLIMAGDARMGGASSNSEAVLPLHNAAAMDAIAGAIAARMGGGGGVTMNVGGVISADNLNKVVKQINRQVGRRQTRLTSGGSYRVTRRG